MINLYTMKNRVLTFIAVSLVLLAGCKEDEPTIGSAPSAADAGFSYQTTATSDNVLQFTAANKGVVAIWDFGNGTSAKGTSAIASYPNKGDYTVTLTIFAKGGSASSTQVVSILQDDFTLLNDPLFTILTGGSDSTNGKTWVVDSAGVAHFGVGPNPIGAAGFYPEWYAAGPLEKAGAGMYDDRYRFHISAFKFDMITNGNVYINTEQESNFPGAYQSSVGDYTAPFANLLNQSWVMSFGDDTMLTVSGNSFLAYYTGVNTYKIIRISENELFLRYLDAANSGLSWYIRLIPAGYIPAGSGPKAKVDLPVTFETQNPQLTAFNGSSAQIVDNPDPRSINTTAKSVETVHGTDSTGGFYITLNDKLDFSADSMLSVKVWSFSAGRTFRLKIENSSNPSQFIEKDVNIPVAFNWVELKIGFTGAAANTYDRLVMFPGWGSTNTATYYVDEIKQTN